MVKAIAQISLPCLTRHLLYIFLSCLSDTTVDDTPTPIDDGNDPEIPEPYPETPEPPTIFPTPEPPTYSPTPEPTYFEIVTTEAATMGPTDFNDPETPEPTSFGDGVTTEPTDFADFPVTEAATMGPTDFNNPETPEPTIFPTISPTFGDDVSILPTSYPTQKDIFPTISPTFGDDVSTLPTSYPTQKDMGNPTSYPTSRDCKDSSCCDTVGFIDEKMSICTDNIGYDCSNAQLYTTDLGYSVEGHQSIMENCQGSCELCEDFPCVCRSLWNNPGSNECVDQIGCPETACDGSFIPYCQIANPGCLTEEIEDKEGFSYTYCDDTTPIWNID